MNKYKLYKSKLTKLGEGSKWCCHLLFFLIALAMPIMLVESSLNRPVMGDRLYSRISYKVLNLIPWLS
jgi:hypothetical protein